MWDLWWAKWHWDRFTPSTSIFPVYIIQPLLVNFHVHVGRTRKTKMQTLGTFQESIALSEIGEDGIEQNFHIFSEFSSCAVLNMNIYSGTALSQTSLYKIELTALPCSPQCHKCSHSDHTKLPTWCTEHYLFVKYYYSPLHVSIIKYSSSGGHSCT